LENQDQLLEVKDRLDFYKHNSTFDGQITQVEDPWGNLISIKLNSLN
jgi:hypothetical protein